MTGGRSLGKGRSENERGNVLPCLMFQFLKNWKRKVAHRGPRRFRSNTDLAICIKLLNLVLITRLSHLVPFSSGLRSLMNFPQKKKLKNLVQLIKGLLIMELRESMEEGPLGPSSCVPFSTSRPLTSGSPRHRLPGNRELGRILKVSIISVYWRGRRSRRHPYIREGSGSC